MGDAQSGDPALTGEGARMALEVEEARLTRAAAGGDGEAFATLYERYARRAYNLSVRLCGSEDDAADAVQEAFLSVMRRLPEIDGRELAFGSYLFTATRNATYDLMRRQQRTRPSDEIPESATPLGAGAGGLGLDPGDPGEDPDRNVLLAAQQEEIAAANARLPERQREALALRELEELSYDEIAATMGMNRNSVAQLISRARINLRDELRGTALASVTASTPECERALPLIAAADDGQLAAGSADAAWLGDHLTSCSTCLLAREAMEEAGVSYRAWIPVAVAPWVFERAMARAAELTGADAEEWEAVAARRLERPADPVALPGLPTAYRDAALPASERPHLRRAALVALLAVFLLLGGAVVALSSGGDGADPVPSGEEVADAPATGPEPETEPGSEPRPAPVAEPRSKEPTQPRQARSGEPPEPAPVPVTEAAAPAPAPVPETRSKPEPKPQPAGEAGLEPPKPVGEPRPEPEPEPVPPPAEEPTEPPPPREPSQPPVPGGPNNPPPTPG